MAKQSIRKRQLEQKLGLDQGDIIKSGFDQETTDIVWDVVHDKYESLLEHPTIKQDEASWPSWVFFLIVHNIHAAIWAIEERYLSTVEVVDEEELTPYDVGRCLRNPCVIRRFHVVLRSDERYYVQPDELTFRGDEPEFDICLYVGTLTLSLQGIKVIMAMIASQNYFLLQSDCLQYCKDFVMLYFDLIEKEISEEQRRRLEKLTVATSSLAAAAERTGRQKPSKGWSIRSFLVSPFVQVYLGTVLGGLTLYILYKLKSLHK